MLCAIKLEYMATLWRTEMCCCPIIQVCPFASCRLADGLAAGGSHLPDLTVIMPAFHESKIIFWTAARAVSVRYFAVMPSSRLSITPISEEWVPPALDGRAHAQIRAGSMPPFSKELWEEGAQMRSFKLVRGGEFDEDGLKRIMCDEPGQYPGCVGTRTWSDVSDGNTDC